MMNGFFILKDLSLDLSSDTECTNINFAPFGDIASDMQNITVVGKVEIIIS